MLIKLARAISLADEPDAENDRCACIGRDGQEANGTWMHKPLKIAALSSVFLKNSTV
jgi:hypothetical protein